MEGFVGGFILLEGRFTLGGVCGFECLSGVVGVCSLGLGGTVAILDIVFFSSSADFRPDTRRWIPFWIIHRIYSAGTSSRVLVMCLPNVKRYGLDGVGVGGCSATCVGGVEVGICSAMFVGSVDVGGIVVGAKEALVGGAEGGTCASTLVDSVEVGSIVVGAEGGTCPSTLINGAEVGSIAVGAEERNCAASTGAEVVLLLLLLLTLSASIVKARRSSSSTPPKSSSSNVLAILGPRRKRRVVTALKGGPDDLGELFFLRRSIYGVKTKSRARGILKDT